MKVLGIIPARKGSKGIINKNIRLINDKPLINYTIEAAKKSKLLTHFLVTSDSDVIHQITKDNNCSFHLRSKENAEDTTPIEPVIFEVLDSLNDSYDLIVLLQPTAPLRTANDIDNVIAMFEEDSNVNCVVSVVALEDIHPARMYSIKDMMLQPLQKQNEKKRRQDLNTVFLRNGCFYAIRTNVFKKSKKLILDIKQPYIMPESQWLNIDSERDLIIAEVMLNTLHI